jgi:hypothetical protein
MDRCEELLDYSEDTMEEGSIFINNILGKQRIDHELDHKQDVDVLVGGSNMEVGIGNKKTFSRLDRFDLNILNSSSSRLQELPRHGNDLNASKSVYST